MENKKDILFLCQFFYPEYNSSATLPFDTAQYLALHGLSVDAMVGYPKEYTDTENMPMHETINQVDIHRIRYVQLKRAKRISRLVNYFSFTASALLHIFKFRKYKCVITYSNPPILPIVAVIANILFNTKIVFVSYDVYPEVAYASKSVLPDSTIDRGMRCINHLLYKRASAVIALTEEMKEFLLTHRSGLAEKRVKVISNWAHEKKIKVTEEAYEKFGYRPEEFVVSYFGNMGTCQEMETLIKAIERLKDTDSIKFLFIGHGNKKAEIEQRFKRQKLTNAHMYDFMTGNDFEQAVSISSCCVVSLEKGLKGTCAPSKYYSYLQGGKPVIAITEKDSYLAKEIETEQIGKAVDIGDVDSLVLAIEKMYQQKDIVRIMGEKAEGIYNQCYEPNIGLNKYYQVVKEIL